MPKEISSKLKTRKEWFVTAKHDGEEHHLYLPRSTRDVLLGCIKKRDAVRRILLNFHPVKDLPRFTLTGESSYEKTRLPSLLAEGAVLRLFEPNKALKTIVNDDGTTKYEEEIKSLIAEVRSLITSILEYYFEHYNVDGTKIPKKTANGRKRKASPQESVRESDVNSGSSQN
ncbi:unnamed protein product [Allacma fusca]|uniref:Uncharacterized protein n=1 Tax=Allacma fusca TaxID=39272 RepID=A0A8J2J775_9HEXA|nr:unnamed protein product [Allacma fusca]